MSARAHRLVSLPPTRGGLDELTFVAAERAGGAGRHGRSYLEVAINGHRLSSLVAVGDHIGVFGWLSRAPERAFAQALALRAPSALPSGRAPLCICPECADLGCGAVAVRVTRHDDCIVWTDLGWDAPYDDEPAPPPTVRDVWFDRTHYLNALARFL